MMNIKNSFSIILLASTATCMYGADYLQPTRNKIKEVFETLVVQKKFVTGSLSDKYSGTSESTHLKSMLEFLELLNSSEGHDIAPAYALDKFEMATSEREVMEECVSLAQDCIDKKAALPKKALPLFFLKGLPILLSKLQNPESSSKQS